MKNLKQLTATLSKFVSIGLILFSALLFIISANTNVEAKILEAEPSVLINTISGTVFDERRQPVANVYVELQDEFYRSYGQTRTSSSGRFTFSGMSRGRYTIKVIGSQFGFEEATVEVEIVNFANRTNSSGVQTSSSDYVQQDIYLRARKNSSDNTGQINGVIYAQEVPENARQSYEKAVSQLKEKNQTEGIKLLEESVTAFPTYYTALNRLGYEYLLQEKFEKASEYFAKAADVNPSEPTVYLLAYSLFLGKNYDTAIQVADKAVELHNSSARIYMVLGGSYRLTKKYDEAEKVLVKAEKLDKNLAETYMQLALLYANNLKKYNEAADQLETFLKLQPDYEDSVQIKKYIQQLKNKAKNK